MEIPVPMPLDNDGFLRRECPNCMKQFKWHSGPANAEAEHQPSPSAYYCPFCGEPAGTDQWWTQQQLDYAEGVAMPHAIREAEEDMWRALRGMNSKNIKVTRTGHLDTP